MTLPPPIEAEPEPEPEPEPVADETGLEPAAGEPDLEPVIDEPGPETISEVEPEPEAEPEMQPAPEPDQESQWLLKVVRGIGLPMIVGSLPEAGIVLSISPPMGNTIRVLSGSKPEFGVGGFETPAPQRGVYTLQFLDQTFKLSMDRQFTRINFVRGAVPAGGQARLVSTVLPHSEAQDWLDAFEAGDKTAGMFTLEEI